MAGFLAVQIPTFFSPEEQLPEKPTSCNLELTEFSHDYPVLLSCEELKKRAQDTEKSTQKKSAISKQIEENLKIEKLAQEEAAKLEAIETERNSTRVPVAEGRYWISGEYAIVDYLRPDSHDGIDLAILEGEPIYPYARGVVSQVLYFEGKYAGCGIMVSIWHEERGITTNYCHLASPNVTIGQEVFPQDVIGFGGSTGFSTGPHLHFMMVSGPDYLGPHFNPRDLIIF